MTQTATLERVVQAPHMIAPPDNGAKTGVEWGCHIQRKYEGRKMVSFPEVYLTAKHGSQESVKRIRDAIALERLLTDTRNFFCGTFGDIVHNSSTNLVPNKEYKGISIPVYDSESIWKLIRDKDGERYLQALCDTDDSGTEIAQNLERYANGSPIQVVTPSQKQRDAGLMDSTLTFYYDFDKEALVIDCKNAYRGITRAVAVRGD